MKTAVLRRVVAGLFLTVLAYVFAGELLQGWIGLHLDAWRERPAFGSARDHLEWQRVASGVALAQQAWPWKTSVYHDAARVQLYGVRGGFVSTGDGGEAVLAAVDQALARSTVNGALLVLEIRGHLLLEDAVGARAAIDRLHAVAPHARPYWQPLLSLLDARARDQPALRSLAQDVRRDYREWAYTGAGKVPAH